MTLKNLYMTRSTYDTKTFILRSTEGYFTQPKIDPVVHERTPSRNWMTPI